MSNRRRFSFGIMEVWWGDFGVCEGGCKGSYWVRRGWIRLVFRLRIVRVGEKVVSSGGFGHAVNGKTLKSLFFAFARSHHILWPTSLSMTISEYRNSWIFFLLFQEYQKETSKNILLLIYFRANGFTGKYPTSRQKKFFLIIIIRRNYVLQLHDIE